MRRPAVAWIALALLVVAGAAALGRGALDRSRTHAVLALIPTLDPVLARHLATDSAARWESYSRSCGARTLMDGMVAAYRVANDWSYPHFVRVRHRYERLTLRIGEALESGYAFPVSARYFRQLMAMPAAEDFELHQLNRAYVVAMTDALSPAERLVRLDRIIAALLAHGDRNGAMTVQFSAAHVEMDAGRPQRFRGRLEAALAEAHAMQDDYLTCQILGELAVVHESAGQPDSMLTCLDQGIALARRHRFPDQTARLMLFDARRATAAGRLALAADRLTEASEQLESFGGGSAGLHLAIEYARFMADEGYWDLAERALRRLPPLIREFPQCSEATELLKYAFDADLVRARVAFAAGDTATGGRLLAGWIRTLPTSYRRIGLAHIDQEWSWGLLRARAWRQALAVSERGLAHCDSAHVPEVAIPLALRRTLLLERLSRLSEARAAAHDAAARITGSSADGSAVQVALAVARARLALRAGRRAAGRRMLGDTFRTLRVRGWRHDSSLRDEDLEGLSLGDAVHELAGLTPAQGYAFELRWRMRSERGAAAVHAANADPFSPVAYRGSGTHLVYHVLPGTVLRWTATRDGVARDTLTLAPGQCLAQVREAGSLLRTDRPPAGAWYGPRLREVLERLSRELLPPQLATARSVEITPDGPLAALPFEALPVDSGVPLAFVTDVAYVHPGMPAARVSGGPAVIVSNPSIPAELQRRYGWPGRLASSDGELGAARALWPGAVVLQADSATKPAFEQWAARATRLYVASHHVRDPATPFVGFIPLAAPAGAPRDACLLESTDVRALDLSRCRLAVLASCASGATGRSSDAPSPSLGEAFLDAGAASVITSFWDVGDDETQTFMRALMGEPGIETDPAHALGDVRRRAMQGRDRSLPRVWAAWSVAVSRPPG